MLPSWVTENPLWGGGFTLQPLGSEIAVQSKSARAGFRVGFASCLPLRTVEADGFEKSGGVLTPDL